MMLPAFKGVDAVAAVEGFQQPARLRAGRRNQRSKKYRNIFRRRVHRHPPVEATPVATGRPRPAT